MPLPNPCLPPTPSPRRTPSGNSKFSGSFCRVFAMQKWRNFCREPRFCAAEVAQQAEMAEILWWEFGFCAAEAACHCALLTVSGLLYNGNRGRSNPRDSLKYAKRALLWQSSKQSLGQVRPHTRAFVPCNAFSAASAVCFAQVSTRSLSLLRGQSSGL